MNTVEVISAETTVDVPLARTSDELQTMLRTTVMRGVIESPVYNDVVITQVNEDPIRHAIVQHIMSPLDSTLDAISPPSRPRELGEATSDHLPNVDPRANELAMNLVHPDTVWGTVVILRHDIKLDQIHVVAPGFNHLISDLDRIFEPLDQYALIKSAREGVAIDLSNAVAFERSTLVSLMLSEGVQARTLGNDQPYEAYSMQVAGNFILRNTLEYADS